MKTLLRTRALLNEAGRWDIDFHLEPEGLKIFPQGILQRVDSIADIASEKRDPSKEPEAPFLYIDIASVDVNTGVIINPQELTGDEAPSRARKVVRAFDIIVSTCRPTRGAIAVVPVELHNQIASTAFSIVRAKPDINPYYLHYALRLDSTLEQFGKWSTGSSYPAILDDDVKKTLIPVPDPEIQEAIALNVMQAFKIRDEAIRLADDRWNNMLGALTDAVAQETPIAEQAVDAQTMPITLEGIKVIIAELSPLEHDVARRRRKATSEIDLGDLFAGDAA